MAPIQAREHRRAKPHLLASWGSLGGRAADETDLGPMELGGLVTAMGTTELKASSLRAVPFDADGISYLDTEWPAHSSTGTDSGDPNGRRFRFLF